MRTAKLDEIVPPEKTRRSSPLSSSLPKATFPPLSNRSAGRAGIREIPDAQERIRAIAQGYVESPEKDADRLTRQCFAPRI